MAIRSRVTIVTIRHVLGLDPAFVLRSDGDYEFAGNVCKERIIDARRANNDDLAADLSLIKAELKKRYSSRLSRHCPRCGEAKAPHARHCQLCYHTERFHHNELMQSTTSKLNAINPALTLIPPPKRSGPKSEAYEALKKLALEGQPGDSLDTDCNRQSIILYAKMTGMQIVMRSLPNSKDPKHPFYRVWRSDGMDWRQLNEYIERRLKGEQMHPAPPCTPPNEEEIRKLRETRHKATGNPPGRPKTH